MVLQGDLYDWNEGNAKNIPANPGVYAFFDAARRLIYIGSSNNLRDRFTGYWQTNFEGSRCKQATRYYKRELTPAFRDREAQLIRAHKPVCNDVIPQT